jgi:hypothetical protein
LDRFFACIHFVLSDSIKALDVPVIVTTSPVIEAMQFNLNGGNDSFGSTKESALITLDNK